MGRKWLRDGGPKRCVRAFLRDQQGGTLVFMAIGLFASVGMAALAVDVGYLYILKNRLQTTADVAALAAVAEIPGYDEVGEVPDQDAMRATALQYAPKNMPASEHGSVLATADVVTGNWDPSTRTFTAAGNPVNAAQVVTRRSQANGNTAPTFFAHLMGIDGVDIMRAAIASKIPPDDCYVNGMVAGNQILASSTSQFLDSYCVYGRNGVTVGSNNTFADGVQIGMLDLADLQSGSDNDGLDDALVEMDLTPDLTADVAGLIADLQADYPDYISQTEYVSVLPDPPVAGTAYIVDQDVNFVSSTVLNDVVIVSTDKITVGSDSSLANVILAAGENVELGSNNTIGDSNYCTGTGDGSVQILATNHVLVGSNTSFTGVQLIAGLDADLGSNDISSTALAIQAGNDIKLGSDLNLGVCGGSPLTHARFTKDKIGLVR